MKLGRNHCFKIFGLLVFLFLISLVSLYQFPTPLSRSMDEARFFHILLKIRLPELLMAITAGAALGLAGALMQIVLDNPLASPFTLGISSAAAFGAALSIVLGISSGLAWLNASAFALAFSALSVVILLAISLCMGVSKKNIILVGLAVNFFFSSANTLMQYYASPDAVYQIMFWTAGSLTNATLNDSLRLFIVFAISLVTALLFSNDMGIIQQGERNAVMHGVNVTLERILILAICSLLASFSVSIIGIIGFVGLVAPHICRQLGLESPKLLVISSSVAGALLLVVSDAISKTLLNPTILPISAVTSCLGIPLVVVLMALKRRKEL